MVKRTFTLVHLQCKHYNIITLYYYIILYYIIILLLLYYIILLLLYYYIIRGPERAPKVLAPSLFINTFMTAVIKNSVNHKFRILPSIYCTVL